ncbi:MAG: PEGA domain-containing protein [Acidobacteria bacterium]|nr:PEGA domain-containing protein [Acidobacteriota bacterium]
MKRNPIILFSLATLVGAGGLKAETTVACQTATVLDVQAREEFEPVSVSTHGTQREKANGKKEVHVYSSPSQKKTTKYAITVRLSDIVYTAESRGDLFWQFKPTVFVVNDAVEACVKKDTLILKRQDGKEYKAKIVRAERDPQGADGGTTDESRRAGAGASSAAAAILQVVSSPANAEIEVDGAFTGHTPSKLHPGAGSHRVTIRKPGYREWSRDLQITAGEINLNVELEPQSR